MERPRDLKKRETAVDLRKNCVHYKFASITILYFYDLIIGGFYGDIVAKNDEVKLTPSEASLSYFLRL